MDEFVYAAGVYCILLPVALAIGFLPVLRAMLLALIVLLERESQNIHNQLAAKRRPAFANSLMFVPGGLWPALFLGFGPPNHYFSSGFSG